MYPSLKTEKPDQPQHVKLHAEVEIENIQNYVHYFLYYCNCSVKTRTHANVEISYLLGYNSI